MFIKESTKATEWSFVTLVILFSKDSERMLSKGRGMNIQWLFSDLRINLWFLPSALIYKWIMIMWKFFVVVVWGGVQGLHQVLVAARGSSLPRVGSLVETWGFLVAAFGIKFPSKGSNPGSQHWECKVLTPEPPGKSQRSFNKTTVLIHLIIQLNYIYDLKNALPFLLIVH